MSETIPAPSTWAELVSRYDMRKSYSAIVLCSGGMDSTACMHIARATYPVDRIVALLVDYGQPHRDRELVFAARLCAELGVRTQRICVADALRATNPDRMASAPHETNGRHPATIPARNLVFLSLATAHGAYWWPRRPLDIWIGACADDGNGFVDCRHNFFAQASLAAGLSIGGQAAVIAPLVGLTKREIIRLAAAEPAVIASMQRSWSCYRGGKEPCGECTPCVLRADAFAAADLIDAPDACVMFGGDPQREIA